MADYLGPYLLGPNSTPENGIYCGDALELARAIPDESVDLIFTDPPYIGDVLHLYEWLGRFAYRVLRSGGSLLCFFGTGFLPQVLGALSAGGMTYRWQMTIKWAGLPVFYGRIAVVGQSCLWLEKGHAIPSSMVRDVWIVSQVSKTRTKYYQASDSNWSGGNASWDKDTEPVTMWADAFTVPGDVIVDPFVGYGTMAVASQNCGAHYLAFEIDHSTCEMARERVRMAQPPLFVPEPQQLEML